MRPPDPTPRERPVLRVTAVGLALLAACGQSPETVELHPTPPPTNPLSVLPRGVHLVSALAPSRRTLVIENRAPAPVLVGWRPEGLGDCGAPGFCLPDARREVRLEAGASGPIEVEFTPGVAPFEVTAALHFSCDAPACAQTVPLFAEALPARGAWRIAPFQRAFRDTRVDESDSVGLLIENLGTTPVRIEEIGLTADSDPAITLDDPPPIPLLLSPGQARPMQARFHPTRLGHAGARVRALDADGNEQFATLSGIGTGGCALDVGSTGFGGILANVPWVHRVRVRNLGDAPCPVDFTVTSSAVGLTTTLIGPPSAIIEPDGDETVTIEVVAACPGTVHAVLAVDGPGFTHEYPIGVQVRWGAPELSPNNLRLEGLRVGCPTEVGLRLSNDGYGPIQVVGIDGGVARISDVSLPAIVNPGQTPLRFTATLAPIDPGPFETRIYLRVFDLGPFSCPEPAPRFLQTYLHGDAAPAGPCD